MNKKISHKIVFSYSLLILFLVVFLLVFFNDLVRNTHLGIIKDEMAEKLRFVELMVYRELTPGSDERKLREIMADASRIMALRITVVDLDGRVIFDSSVKRISDMDNHRYRAEISRAISSGSGESIRYSNTLRIDELYSAKFISPYVYRLAKPLYDIDRNLSAVRNMILSLGLIVVLISVAVTVYISNKITRPIKATLYFARHFSEGDYTRRILNYSEDEIGEVQRALNKMADMIVDKINGLVFEQKKLEITLESISDGIAVIDRNKKMLIANNAFLSILSITSSVVNRPFYEVIRNRSLNSKIEYALEAGSSIGFEEHLIGGAVLDVIMKPIQEEKALQGILVVLHDITEKKKVEQIKTDLVSNMSHELKTPVTIIKGYLETIQENIGNTEQVRSYIGKAIANAERQNAIINDILKLNMIETSNDFPMENVNLKDVISGCGELLKPKALAKSIALEVDLGAVDESVQTGRFLAEEVFFNLIDNAINYTNEGGRVAVTAEKSGDRKMIMISDTGIGIPRDAIDRIFERFYRVDKSRSRDTGGTGLGLSIVKHAADMLGWNIEVKSDNSGSVFTIIV